MVLESTMVCVDNSDFTRNGDFVPTRLQAQQDAVSLVCHSKTRANPENNVGLMTLATMEVLTTLTGDVGRILSKLHEIKPKGNGNFVASVRIAHLALKHRQSKLHKARIVVFVCSPIEETESELLDLAKRLKKEKVSIDIVNFGEEGVNTEKLTAFINRINGKDGGSSHLVTVPPGPLLSDALASSPIVAGENGAMPTGMGYEFGFDPNEDPELAMALRISMEEQRLRQDQDTTNVAAESAPKPMEGTNEDAVLHQALMMSRDGTSVDGQGSDITMLSEEEQMQMALQMSMQSGSGVAECGEDMTMTEEADEDFTEEMNDPAFLQSVLESLPGVDPNSEAVRSAVGALTSSGAKGGDANKKSSGDKKKESDK